jgi:ubiquinone/menaquinone biosynthesis C-methylase UbiE
MIMAYPDPLTYEREIDLWPWKKILKHASDYIIQHAPRGSLVVDYMCGPGQLLRLLEKKRPDLRLSGCDWNSEFIRHAQALSKNINYVCCDATKWSLSEIDIAVCTAGVHHLRFNQQQSFLRKLSRAIGPQGLVILGEEFLPEHTNTEGRIDAICQLYTAVFEYLIKKKPDRKVIEVSIQVLLKDVFARGEYKRTKTDFCRMLSGVYQKQSWTRLWPSSGLVSGGDYFAVLKHLD